MKKKQLNVFKICFLVLLIGVILVIGLFLYDSESQLNNQDVISPISDNSSNSADLATSEIDYSDWIVYDDEYMSFKYPKDWTVNRQYTFSDSYGAHQIIIKSPVDNSLTAANVSSSELYLQAGVLIAEDGRFTGNCVGCGKVFNIESIKTSDSTEGSLIIAGSGDTDEPAAISLVANQVTIGEKYAPDGIRVGDFYSMRIEGSYKSGDLSLVGFRSVSDIKDSKQYDQLRNIIKSIKTKPSNLPIN